MSLHPYPTFSGTTHRALNRYHEISGGRLEIDRLMAPDDSSGDGTAMIDRGAV